MSKFTLLLLAVTATLVPGCYAHTGYYAEPAYVAAQPVYVAPQPVYVQPYPYGYAHVRVTPVPTYSSRPVYVEPRRTYTMPRHEYGRYAGAARVGARPLPSGGDSRRPWLGRTRR